MGERSQAHPLDMARLSEGANTTSSELQPVAIAESAESIGKSTLAGRGEGQAVVVNGTQPFYSQLMSIPSANQEAITGAPGQYSQSGTGAYGGARSSYPSPMHMGHMATALPGPHDLSASPTLPSQQYGPNWPAPAFGHATVQAGAVPQYRHDYGQYYPEYSAFPGGHAYGSMYSPTNYPQQQNMQAHPPSFQSGQYHGSAGYYFPTQGRMPAHPHIQSPYASQSYTRRFNEPVSPGTQYTVSPPRSQTTTIPDRANVEGMENIGHSTEWGILSVPRGPPRKPRQSGHALWVGNLPPGATVTDLKDHFSREATNDIESIKLISKSNCAFVNYRTQAACIAAMERFHDSRFQGSRLVCRLRRAIPSSPMITLPTQEFPTNSSSTKTERPANENVIVPEADQKFPTARYVEAVPERFFVLKSLTLHDLEISTRTGVWATQSHNEEKLNRAFMSASSVYLIFSANKSGEYFGYARMCSLISASEDEPGTGPNPTPPEPSDLQLPEGRSESVSMPLGFAPKVIRTPETEWAPKGRIIDDLARGTIFWEADVDEDSVEVETTTTSASAPPTYRDQPAIASSSPSQPLQRSPVLEPATTEEESLQQPGRSFQVEWLSTQKVPFYKTRGLRNPWNANREVKIARDGTELEPRVGRKLLNLFTSPVPGRGDQ